jgi:hypothetical protein
MLALAGFAARIAGHALPPPVALAGFHRGCEEKPQPCWYGIVPGITETAAAAAHLQQAGYAVVSTVGAGLRKLKDNTAERGCQAVDFEFSPPAEGSGLITRGGIRVCGEALVGDLLRWWDIPQKMAIFPNYDGDWLSLWYPDGFVFIYTRHRSRQRPPFSAVLYYPVETIILSSSRGAP